jgi:hypothetical protein
MRKAIVAVVLGLLSGASVVAQTPAASPKSGNISARKVLSATIKALPMGKERLQVTYESLGAIFSEAGDELLQNASARCLGAFHAVNGAIDDESGSCVYMRPDGDQLFVQYRAAGKLGSAAKGTATIVGGTGKLLGAQGTLEWARTTARSAAEGTSQVIISLKGSYKLP